METAIIDYLDSSEVSSMYSRGYLFGRNEPGFMYKARSVRVNLEKFTPNSENRRVLKNSPLEISTIDLPIASEDYDFRLHKLAKDFYEAKFPDSKFSASKIRSLLREENHFNLLFSYSNHLGYCIAYQNEDLVHYCYPYYDLSANTNNLGMSMMLQAILWAQAQGKKYVYLGGSSRPQDKYKLQFSGLEWWDESSASWSPNLEQLKELLTS